VRWAEAQDTVLAAYGGFAPDMASIAKRFFDGSWIDAPVREGKAPGAFSHPTVPSAHPYILMNFQGKLRDVMTLAHELGHGVHQILAAPQGALLAPTPLTLAETASVFGEMLTFRALLGTARDARERKALLAQKVEDMINTVVRQIAFYCFERKVHEERRTGELTPERLGQIWLEVQSESLGPAIDLGEGYETYWSYIPHFVHSPFYVYAYAFGDCLVNSLYGLYGEAHPDFVTKYFEMLKAGGSKHHSELLKPVRARRVQARVLAEGPRGHRGPDRRVGGDGTKAGIVGLRRTVASELSNPQYLQGLEERCGRRRRGENEHGLVPRWDVLRAGVEAIRRGLSQARRGVYKPRAHLPGSVAGSRNRRQWHKQPPPTAPRTGIPTSSSGPWRLDRSASSMATSARAPFMRCARRCRRPRAMARRALRRCSASYH
jgi:hypothetical protein